VLDSGQSSVECPGATVAVHSLQAIARFDVLPGVLQFSIAAEFGYGAGVSQMARRSQEIWQPNTVLQALERRSTRRSR